MLIACISQRATCLIDNGITECRVQQLFYSVSLFVQMLLKAVLLAGGQVRMRRRTSAFVHWAWLSELTSRMPNRMHLLLLGCRPESSLRRDSVCTTMVTCRCGCSLFMFSGRHIICSIFTVSSIKPPTTRSDTATYCSLTRPGRCLRCRQ